MHNTVCVTTADHIQSSITNNNEIHSDCDAPNNSVLLTATTDEARKCKKKRHL